MIRAFYRKIPILGVCLGHECIGELFGARVVHAKKILHGKTSAIYHRGTGIFKNLSSPFSAARYHSLVIDRVPEEFCLDAWNGGREIMARRIDTLARWLIPLSYYAACGLMVLVFLS